MSIKNITAFIINSILATTIWSFFVWWSFQVAMSVFSTYYLELPTLVVLLTVDIILAQSAFNRLRLK